MSDNIEKKEIIFEPIEVTVKGEQYLIDNESFIMSIDGKIKEFSAEELSKNMTLLEKIVTEGLGFITKKKELAASFSNYGDKTVDVFAPGVEIYSTVPKDNYKAVSGTSMAAPAVAGVAALIRSYYPKLTASQVKHILMNSGVKIAFDVIKPGSQSRENPKGEMVSFSELSVSGRIVNAYNALKMADKIVNGK